jgi:hypothetical protein
VCDTKWWVKDGVFQICIQNIVLKKTMCDKEYIVKNGMVKDGVGKRCMKRRV